MAIPLPFWNVLAICDAETVRAFQNETRLEPTFLFYRRIFRTASVREIRGRNLRELGFIQCGDVGLERQPPEEDPNHPEKLAIQRHRRKQGDHGIARQGQIELSSPLGSWLQFGSARLRFWVE